jgi:acetylornithine/succinyldiaminopimelate/putrescine aminotransferase
MGVGRYRAATNETRRIIEELNTAGRPNFSFAGLLITEEAAQAGYLMSRLHSASTDYITYFSNSLEESISGVVKLARHTQAQAAVPPQSRSVLIVDTSGELRAYFNPGGSIIGDCLAPGLEFVESLEQARTNVQSGEWCAVIVALNTKGAEDDAASLSEIARARGILFAVADRRAIPPRSREATLPAAQIDCDVRIYGESLTDFQAPFGCFVMSYDAYQVWNNPIDAFAHSSTFAANAVVLTIMAETLRRKGYLTAEHNRVLAEIRTDRRTRNTCYGQFVNPSSALITESFSHDFAFESAKAETMTLRDGRSLLDMASGTGSNLRGNNPTDLTEEVLAVHDVEHDYIAELRRTLFSLTGFEELFPAVSGSTSVELALALARLARPQRPKIVTFRGNFSGKTLAAQNVSKYGPQRSASIPDAFAPYYPHIVFVDIDSATAAGDLSVALSDPAVGLFWCELVQGYQCFNIPEHLLEVVRRAKTEHDVMVGFDEVLTGVWRASENEFLYHQELGLTADLVTIAKPLSDMTLPMGACLARSTVIEEVHRSHCNGPDIVESLRQRYRNNLAAHIAVHALQVVDQPDAQAIRRKERATMLEGLTSLVDNSRIYSSIEGSGAHIRLALNKRYFPGPANGTLEDLVETSLEEIILKRCGVLLGRGRVFAPIFPPQGSMDQTMSALHAGFPTITVPAVYRNLARALTRLAVNAVRRRIRPPRLAEQVTVAERSSG